MPRKIFKRWLPDPANVRNTPALKFLGVLLHDPNLFHLNRHSVSVAFFAGLFIAFLPVPGQTPLAAVAALLFRCNLPIAMALVWVSNPLTFPVIFFGAYKLGAWMLQVPYGHFTFELSWEWLKNDFLRIWQPLILGCVISGLFFGTLGFLIIQWTWRWHVISRWQARGKKMTDKQPRSHEPRE